MTGGHHTLCVVGWSVWTLLRILIGGCLSVWAFVRLVVIPSCLFHGIGHSGMGIDRHSECNYFELLFEERLRLNLCVFAKLVHIRENVTPRVVI